MAVPKSRTWRISKALPLPPLPPPPPPPAPTKALPEPPWPRRSTSTGSNLSPPSLPTLQTPMMAIPRKPIANLQQPSPSPSPSPTDSLSSLLSAYTRDSDETTPASLCGQEEGASPTLDKYYFSCDAGAEIGSSGSRPTHPGSGPAPGAAQHQRNLNRPPPPPKDSELPAPSPPRPEIWRRRPHMSQNSRELPGLHLDHSHGSTADAQVQAQSQSQAQRPPSNATGLPGRNIRPPPAKEQPPPAAQTMGHEASKLKHIKEKLGSSQRSVPGPSMSTRNGLPGRPAGQRPPTPEYQKEDINEPAVDLFVSPVSPASSPEAPRGVSPDFSKELPPQPPTDEPQINTIAPNKPIPRKALPTIIPGQDPNNAQTNTFSPAGGSPPTLKGNTIPTREACPPNDTASSRPHDSEQRATLQSQNNAAAQPDVQIVVEPPRFSQTSSDPRLVQSQTQGPLYRGRDGTLYPEMKVDREPHPQAAYFPVQRYQSLPKEGVIKARPVTDTHFNCFQEHRTMNRRGNRNYPLTCQTCDGSDVDDRWTCTFCNLRICDLCFRKLNACQRDLRRLVDNVANSAPLSLSSQARPGTALGLQSVS